MKWYRWEWQDKGPEIMLEPWIPITRMPNEDDFTPRICVAPSPELAFLALRECAPETPDKLILYELVDGPCPVPVTRERVPDAHRTKEHWILTPAKFQRVG